MSTKGFDVSNEWQDLPEGASVPVGSHVRLDMTTGQRTVRLDQGDIPNTTVAVQYDGVDEVTSSRNSEELRLNDPTSWKGLLEWSTRFKDNCKPSEFTPMEKERANWLMDALEGMADGEIKQMQTALTTIAENFPACFNANELTKVELERKENALECLSDLVDMIDNANNLVSIGGFPYVIAMLKSPYQSLVWRALDVLAVSTQNNPTTQDYCVKEKVMEIALPLMGAQTDNKIQAKALYFMSSLIRHNEVASANFIARNGVLLLTDLLVKQSSLNDTRAVTKALFMLKVLLDTMDEDEKALTKSYMKNASIVPALVSILSENLQDNSTARELALALLVRIKKVGPEGEDILYQPELRLTKVLADLKMKLESLPAEERESVEEEIESISVLQL
eukprot:CFRG5510T1